MLESIKVREAILEMFANVFFVFLGLYAFNTIPFNNDLVLPLTIGGIYLLVVLVFHSAWIDLNPVLTIFKYFKKARTLGNSIITLIVQFLASMIAGFMYYAADFDVTVGADMSSISPVTTMIVGFMASAVLIMTIFRITVLKDVPHIVTTGFAYALGIFLLAKYGSVFISPLHNCGAILAHNIVSNGSKFVHMWAHGIGSIAVLPLALWCHFFVSRGGDVTWER